MSQTTEIRRAIGYALESLQADVRVSPARTDYGASDRSPIDERRFEVLVVAGPPEPAAEELLDEMLDPTGARSVRELLHADRTLGGVVADTEVIQATGYQTLQHGDRLLLGAAWVVRIIT